MIQKLLSQLVASVRDVILAGVAAGAGFLIGKEIPGNSAELKALLAAALYAFLRGIIGKIVELVS